MVTLYDGAEAKSYYKFLKEIEHVPDVEIRRVKSLKGDPESALPFARRSDIQRPGYTPVPEGVYMAKDGGLFVSIKTPCPHINAENAEWWMIWHQLDPLRYAIWNPEDHYDVKVSDACRARILDESLPIRERMWGVSCDILESMNGEEPSASTLNFISPEQGGFDKGLFGTDACQAMLITNNQMAMGPVQIPIMMIEWVRKAENGENEWCVYAWLGHGVKEDGFPWSAKVPFRKKVAEAMPAMLIAHSHKKMAHLDGIITELYAENKDNWVE